MTDKLAPVLSVQDLTVDFKIGEKYCHAVKDVSLCVQPGEMVALVNFF